MQVYPIIFVCVHLPFSKLNLFFMKRLFIAITIESSCGLEDFTNALNEIVPQNTVKWVNPSQYHLTLKFLGDTGEKDIGQIKDEIIKEEIKDFIASCENTVFSEELASEFHLIESTLTKQGPKYHNLETYKLS